MTQPLSILNTRGQSTDTLWGADGISKIKLAIGTKSAGLTPDAGWQGVATHTDGETFDANDGVVVLSGVDGSTVRKIKVNSQGEAFGARPTTVVSATPTLDTSAYASGDSLHTAVITFANAVRVSAGTGSIRKLIVIDKDAQGIAGEIWLFSATVTPATANAAHSISDADAALCVGIIPFGTYYASALNKISVAQADLPFHCAATSLFAILVTRGAPTYTASGLIVALHVQQD